MNLKLKRLVRTSSSEQYALFDLTQLDDAGQPMTIGKLDLHYTGEGIYGTLLLWDDLSRALRPAQRSLFIRALLDEIAQPMGVPPEYVIEYFAPSLDGYEVYHNVSVDEEVEEEDYEAGYTGEYGDEHEYEYGDGHVADEAGNSAGAVTKSATIDGSRQSSATHGAGEPASTSAPSGDAPDTSGSPTA